MKPSISELHEFLRLDSETGILYWKKKTTNRVKVGEVAGSLTHGYLEVAIYGKKCRCHHVVWAMETGAYPELDKYTVIDHINGDKADNRLSNLRIVNRSQNGQNSKPQKVGKTYSKWKGVTWDAARGKWKCQIRPYPGAAKIQKRFDDEREAAEEYIFLALEHHGEYARFD